MGKHVDLQLLDFRKTAAVAIPPRDLLGEFARSLSDVIPEGIVAVGAERIPYGDPEVGMGFGVHAVEQVAIADI